jgi:hypothetical protein
MPKDGVQHLVFQSCLAHAGLTGVIPLDEMPAQMACQFVERLWSDVESELPLAERVADAAFDVSDNVQDGIRVRVFVLPACCKPIAASLVALVVHDGVRRVFLLEPGRRAQCLIESTSSHRLNYNSYALESEINPADFATLIAQIIRDQLAPRIAVRERPIFCPSIRGFLHLVQLARAVGVWPATFADALDPSRYGPAPDVQDAPRPKSAPWWRFW